MFPIHSTRITRIANNFSCGSAMMKAVSDSTDRDQNTAPQFIRSYNTPCITLMGHLLVYSVSYSSAIVRDHFVCAPSQWEMMLQCNVISHWLDTCTKWSLKSLCWIFILHLLSLHSLTWQLLPWRRQSQISQMYIRRLVTVFSCIWNHYIYMHKINYQCTFLITLMSKTTHSLKHKGHHIDEFFITGCTRGCHDDNLWCSER